MVKWRERLNHSVNRTPKTVLVMGIPCPSLTLLLGKYGLYIFTPESGEWPIMTTMATLCLDGILEDSSVRGYITKVIKHQNHQITGSNGFYTAERLFSQRVVSSARTLEYRLYLVLLPKFSPNMQVAIAQSQKCSGDRMFGLQNGHFEAWDALGQGCLATVHDVTLKHGMCWEEIPGRCHFKSVAWRKTESRFALSICHFRYKHNVMKSAVKLNHGQMCLVVQRTPRVMYRLLVFMMVFKNGL